MRLTSTTMKPWRPTWKAAVLILSLIGGTASAQQATAARQVPEALNLANGLLRDRHYELAADQYAGFLKTNPPVPQAAEARYGLATARLFLGQYRDARAEFERFLADFPEHPNAPSARFRAGETAYMLGDLTAARDALGRYARENPGHRHLETALPYLGDVSFRLGELAEARKAYEQALAQFPEGRLQDRARYGLARTLAAQGEPDAAVKLLRELVEHGGRDWADRARYQIGVTLADAGRDAEAVEAFQALESTAPNSPLVPEARLQRAEALNALGKTDEAEALLRTLTTSGEQSIAARAAYALGGSQLDRGEPAEALATWNDALTRFAGSPLVPALLFRSAEALVALGKSDEARARFLQIVEQHPKADGADAALVCAAELALKAGEPARARELAARLPNLAPESPLRADARLIEARAAIDAKQPAEAIPLLETLLETDKPSPAVAQSARYYLGLAYRDTGQKQKAADVLGALAEMPEAPAAADALYVVGEEAFHADPPRYADAIGPLEKYLEARPKGEVADHALTLLAISYQELGQDAKARAVLDRLVQEFPQSQALAATARLRLAQADADAGRFDQAAALYRLAAEGTEDPQVKVRALSGLGWSLLKAKHPAEAAEAYTALLEADPQGPLAADAALDRARALEEAGKTAEALAAYAHVTETYPQSDRAPTAALARARLLVREDRPEEAAAAFETARNLLPKTDAEAAAGVLAEWGAALLDAGKTDEADAVFRRLLTEHPASPRAAEARVNLAESAIQAGKLDEARTLLEPVAAGGDAVEPSLKATALYRLGDLAARRGDWTTAAEWFGQVVDDYPTFPHHLLARFWKAESEFQAGHVAEAEAAFAALAVDPAVADASWRPTVRLRHIETLVQQERWADAAKEAEALAPDLPEGFALRPELAYARGRALLGLARFDEARDAFQAVIDARKGTELAARAQLMRGESFFHQERYDDALKEFFKVEYFYNAPTWQATALLEAGKVFELRNQWRQAAEVYETLRTKHPNTSSATEAAKRLAVARSKAGSATR